MKHILGENSSSILEGVQEGDSQPNAVDLRLDKVLKITDSLFEVSEEHKVHRETRQVDTDEDGYYNLTPGSYEITMENTIGVGDGEAGFVITRSTLNRNGLYITSGLYDSGYGFDAKTKEFTGGVMAGVLHVTSGNARIKKGTRVGQFLNFDAEQLSHYDGSYGNHKEHDSKYN